MTEPPSQQSDYPYPADAHQTCVRRGNDLPAHSLQHQEPPRSCGGSKQHEEKTPMRPKLFLAVSTLALGTALAAAPAIAQTGGTNSYGTGRAMNDGGYQASGGTQGAAPSNSAPRERAQTQGGDTRQYYNYAGPNFGGPTLSTGSSACAARFRSYDPATGTYMGFDGIRHPCP
jgi:hypothetical protein